MNEVTMRNKVVFDLSQGKPIIMGEAKIPLSSRNHLQRRMESFIPLLKEGMTMEERQVFFNGLLEFYRMGWDDGHDEGKEYEDHWSDH